MRDRIQHRLLAGGGRKQGVLQSRKQAAEHGRSEQHAADELAHDGGLADAFHELADESAADNEGDDLAEEDGQGGFLRGAAGRCRCRCGQRRTCGGAGQERKAGYEPLRERTGGRCR